MLKKDIYSTAKEGKQMVDLIASIMKKPSIDLDKAYEELMSDNENVVQIPVDDEQPKSPENLLGMI